MDDAMQLFEMVEVEGNQDIRVVLGRKQTLK